MALRVLSGVISNADGPVQDSVVIGFNPHVVLSAPPRVEVVDMRTVGAAGAFSDVPAEHVALRELDFRIPGLLLFGRRTRFFIDTATTPDQITIQWSKGAETIGIAPEISYMIIGDVADGSAVGAGTVQPPGGNVTPDVPGIGDRPPFPITGGTDRNRR